MSYSPKISRSTHSVVKLETAEQEFLASLHQNVKTRLYEDGEHFFLDAALLFHELPTRIRQELVCFERYGNERGYLLISGLPLTKPLPPTPTKVNGLHNPACSLSELWLAVLATPFGNVCGYAQERQGRLIQDIVPSRESAKVQTSASFEVVLEMHTELAFHSFRPDYVLLSCVRPDHDRVARTLVASIRKILPLLSPTERSALFCRDFLIGVDLSFGGGAQYRDTQLPCSVLYGNPNDPLMRYDRDLMCGSTRDARQALRRFEAVVANQTEAVALETGDLLILDNRRTAHGRTVFTPRFDGQDRWLQRAYVRHDMAEPTTSSDNGRIIADELY
jgi:hypothetical protein